jgi:hypothetical protein
MRGTSSGQHEHRSLSTSVEAETGRPAGMSYSGEKVRTCLNASFFQDYACGIPEKL